MEQAGGPRTARGWGTGAALAAELLQGVDSYVEVDVFAATAITHQLLLIKGLTERKGSDQNTSTPHPPLAGCLPFVPSGRQRPLMDRT